MFAILLVLITMFGFFTSARAELAPEGSCVDTFFVDQKATFLVACDRVFVKYKPSVPYDTVEAIEQTLGADTADTPLPGWILYELPSPSNLTQVVSFLRSSPWIDGAHPDLVVEPCLEEWEPWDELWPDQRPYLSYVPDEWPFPPQTGRGFNLVKAWQITRGNQSCAINVVGTGSPACPPRFLSFLGLS
ncbi:hypothetical protein KKH27_11520 [bacterium]|nr:hypothetical protein [bacterium]